ncbi:MAG TPA: DUF455 family protein [Myxococcota bacterium]|jgi:uncharacterized ferritin-like protein (DUF455 family)
MFSEPTLRASCLRVLTSGELAAKLAPLARLVASPPRDTQLAAAPLAARALRPARSAALTMGPGAAPLPRPEALGDVGARALALARFAHHELQAAELFAAALLRWPELPLALTLALAGILEDEQRHARLYLDRLAALGARFEDFAPHSDYFWKHAGALLGGTPAAFFAAMGLTLEQANLDFSGIYRDAFAAAGDAESAAVCALVHADEIGHVALAARALRELGVAGAGDTQRFEAAVPFPFSAARAKGRRFDARARHAAGLDEKFIAHVRHARSPQEAPRSRHAGLALLANLGAEEGAFAERARSAPQPRALAALWHALWDEPLAFEWLPRAGLAAWLNDAAAEAAARDASCALFGAPAGVVREVHDKAFAWRSACEAGLAPESLRDVIAVLEAAELRAPDAARAIEARVAAWPPWARRDFVLKPRFGTSARGRASGGVRRDARWHSALPRLAERGGALLEPWLARTWDASTQLLVHPGGSVELLGTLVQELTPAGAVRAHRGVIDARGGVRSGLAADGRLREAALQIARAAARAGYRGPCGVDAFAFRDAETGAELLRPVVELNARFTLGTVAIGHALRARAAQIASGALARDESASFVFALDGAAAPAAEGAVRIPLGAGAAALVIAHTSGSG